MLRAPPTQVLAAMRLLVNTSPEFNSILNWLRAEREAEVITLSVNRDQWSVGQAQGSVQTLDSYLNAVESSKR